jgi:serine protease Do
VHIGERGLLGVRVSDIASQVSCTSVPANSGALVVGVNSGSPADSAGVGACDVIVSIGGTTIATTSGLNAAMFWYGAGERVTVGWVDQSGHRQNSSMQLIAGSPE